MTDNEHFKLAAIQAAPVMFDRDASTEKACRLIGEAGAMGASIAGFGESWLAGYPFFAFAEMRPLTWRAMAEYLASAVEIPSPTTDQLCEAARLAGIDVVIGVVERDAAAAGTVYCTLLFIGREGRILGRHRKIKPTFHERSVWGDGDAVGLTTYQRPYGRISGLNCWEHNTMLPGYVLAAQGTQIHVAAWPGREPAAAPAAPTPLWPRQLLLSRAFASQAACYVIAAGGVRLNADTPDRYRELSTFEHTGDSYIIDPRGEIIAGPAQGETILIAEGSMEADRAAKALSDIGGHYSRPDLLRLIVDRSPQTRMAERGIAPDPENADRAARQRQVLDGQQPSCLVLPELFLPEFWGVCRMHTVLDYCTGGIERSLTAGATVIREGETTGHLYILIEGRLEVVKGDTVVAIITEPGAVLGEMSVLLDQPHTATVRAASDSTIYEFGDAASFLHEQPAVALLVARLLAQRLNVATTYLADIMKQYAGHGDHLAMVGEILQSMINLPPIKISPGSDRQSDSRL